MEENSPSTPLTTANQDSSSDPTNNLDFIDGEPQAHAAISVPQKGNENVIEIDTEKKEITVEELNKHTLEFYDKKHKRTIYVFDYSGIQISAKDLFSLRINKEWKILKHPFIFNYINELLLRCSFIYGIQLALNFIYLCFLLINVHVKFESTAITSAIIILAILCLGAIMKLYVQSKLSKYVEIDEEPLDENAISLIIRIFYMLYLYFNFHVIWLPIYFDNDKKLLSDVETEYSRTLIVFIFISWIHCLYVLRLSPCGIHIAMLTKMFRSFLKLSVILVTTIVCFTFCFQLAMKGSKIYPWDDSFFETNVTTIEILWFQSFVKITAMMTGELEASNFLERENRIVNLILIMFEIIAVILLMNLMISLAVGDVAQLRQYAEETMFSMKTRYCIEALGALKYCFFLRWIKWDLTSINNIMIIPRNDKMEFSNNLDTWVLTRDSKRYPLKRIQFSPMDNYNANTTLSINNTTVNLHFNDGTIHNDNKQFIEYLSCIKNYENYLKFVRWFIGLSGKLLAAKKASFCKHCGNQLES